LQVHPLLLLLLLDLYSAMSRLNESERCDGAEPS